VISIVALLLVVGIVALLLVVEEGDAEELRRQCLFCSWKSSALKSTSA